MERDQLPGLRIRQRSQQHGIDNTENRRVRTDAQREGNFAADFFNVRRVTHVTGWRFEALVVLSDHTVLFRNIAGEPNIDRVERRTNPLGPLQPAGEAAGSLLLH